MSLTIGVDLGSRRDHSALVLSERRVRIVGETPAPEPRVLPGTLRSDTLARRPEREVYWDVHRIERLALGTTYPAILGRLVGMVRNLAARGAGEVRVNIDATGAGGVFLDDARPAFEALPNAVLMGVTLTGSGREPVRRIVNGWTELSVNKELLITALSMLLQQHRIDFPSDSRDLPAMRQELLGFEGRQRASGHTAYNAVDRVGEHDDLIVASALSVLAVLDAPAPRLRMLDASPLWWAVAPGERTGAPGDGGWRRTDWT